MNIIILTSSVKGMAAHTLPRLFNESSIKITMVVFNEGEIINKKKYYLKKIKKIFKIGLLGAVNGIKMRKWFSKETDFLFPDIDLETFCLQNNIPFERTPSINCDNTRRIFRNSNASIGISLGNSYISESVFSICPLGMINIHGEILPDYQNAQSIIWQLYNGSSKTGYTIHKINKKIDDGDILYQEVFPIVFKNNLANTVSYNCAQITKKACQGLIKVLKDFNYYNLNSTKQIYCKSYTTPSWRQFKKIKKQFLELKNLSPNLTVVDGESQIN